MVWFGLGYDMGWYGMVWYDMVWFGMIPSILRTAASSCCSLLSPSTPSSSAEHQFRTLKEKMQGDGS